MEPDSTTPSGAAPREEADLPGFGPSRRREPDPLDPQATTVYATTGGPNPIEATIPAGEWSTTTPAGDELDDDEAPWLREASERTAPSSTPGSTSRVADPSIAAAAAGMFALVAQMGSLVLDRTIGRGSHAWLMHPEEAQAIADPLGRIAARHAPIGTGEAGDIADAIDAGVATAAYAMRATVTQHGAAAEPETMAQGPIPDAGGVPPFVPYAGGPIQ